MEGPPLAVEVERQALQRGREGDAGERRRVFRRRQHLRDDATEVRRGGGRGIKQGLAYLQIEDGKGRETEVEEVVQGSRRDRRSCRSSPLLVRLTLSGIWEYFPQQS